MTRFGGKRKPPIFYFVLEEFVSALILTLALYANIFGKRPISPFIPNLSDETIF